MKKLLGTSIIEIIIAAALISMAIIAALSLMNRSQKQNTYGRDLAQATKYATQAAEWLRTERNRLGWATIADKIEKDNSGSIYCLNILPNAENENFSDITALTPEGCAEGSYIPDTTFQRTMIGSIDPENPNLIKFTISVNWYEATSRQATIEMELTQW